MNPSGSLDRFGNYILLKLLATGGMANVFLARSAEDSGNGRIVVLKRILPAVADNTEFQMMFKSEIRVLAGLNHPNIVQIHDFGRVGGHPYIVMEHVDGKSVGELIERYAKIGRK